MTVRLGPVSSVGLPHPIPKSMTSLTCCEYPGPKYTATGLILCVKGTTTPLTDQRPELVSHREIPDLHHPFRMEGFCYGGWHTTRKSAKAVS